jgi:uncharacterized protein (DUF779 family)
MCEDYTHWKVGDEKCALSAIEMLVVVSRSQYALWAFLMTSMVHIKYRTCTKFSQEGVKCRARGIRFLTSANSRSYVKDRFIAHTTHK